VLAIFILHLSYVQFSRFGITVLFQRIVNPGMNGYFSSAVQVETHDYLENFPDLIDTLDQHARDHPPGSILLIQFVVKAITLMNLENTARYVPKPDGDVKVYWDALSNSERLSSIFLAFFYHLCGALTVLPVYLIGRLYFISKKALSISLLWGFVPSLSFFALKFDPFYFLLFSTASYFFLSAIKTGSSIKFYIAGVWISICLFFSYYLIPGIAVLFIYFISKYLRHFLLLVDRFVKVLIGILFPILGLLILGYNSFSAFFPIVSNQAPRSYWQWVIYNPFDFFQYFGVVTSCIFLMVILQFFKNTTDSPIRKLSLIFLFFFAILDLTGISRAEVGRIWMPLMLFPLLAIGAYKDLSLRWVVIGVSLLFIQVIIMTEFWVPIW
jgi:hypothetical protein